MTLTYCRTRYNKLITSDLGRCRHSLLVNEVILHLALINAWAHRSITWKAESSDKLESKRASLLLFRYIISCEIFIQSKKIILMSVDAAFTAFDPAPKTPQNRGCGRNPQADPAAPKGTLAYPFGG